MEKDNADIGNELPPTTIKLAIEPDVIIIIEHSSKPETQFEVSSLNLGQASPYFRTLLRSSFEEGALVRQGCCPEITLGGDDDPEAIEILFRILHAQPALKYLSLSLSMVSTIARHSDKYLCTAALLPWTKLWLEKHREYHTTKELGQLLLASYCFQEEGHFLTWTTEAMFRLSPQRGVWLDKEVLEVLPQHVTGEQLSLPPRRSASRNHIFY